MTARGEGLATSLSSSWEPSGLTDGMAVGADDCSILCLACGRGNISHNFHTAVVTGHLSCPRSILTSTSESAYRYSLTSKSWGQWEWVPVGLTWGWGLAQSEICVLNVQNMMTCLDSLGSGNVCQGWEVRRICEYYMISPWSRGYLGDILMSHAGWNGSCISHSVSMRNPKWSRN